MRVNFIILGLALAGISSALPTEDSGLYGFRSKRAVSPDNTCGNVYAGANNSYTCDATINSGGCCSQYGTCASLRPVSCFCPLNEPQNEGTVKLCFSLEFLPSKQC